jgi:hypothetical protein
MYTINLLNKSTNQQITMQINKKSTKLVIDIPSHANPQITTTIHRLKQIEKQT